MWIVILNLCLFILLVSLFLYGLKNWQNLINEPEEESKVENTDMYYYRAPFWLLLTGIGIFSIIREIINFAS